MSTKFKNRIVGEGVEAPDQLLANPKNWRTHPQFQQDALTGVLKEVGYVQRVIVNRNTGFVVDGHARVAIAMRENQPEIPVLYVDLTEEEEAKVLATLDPIGALAGKDDDQLRALLDEVNTDDPALQALLDSLADGLPEVVEGTEGLTDEDATPELAPEPITKPGDVWVMGGHRLMCGDSTSIDAFTRLMSGALADMVFTDPPYGMSYEGGRGKKSFGMIANDDAQGDDLVRLVRDALVSAKTFAKDGASAYVCFPWRTYADFEQAMLEAVFPISACIVWDKKHFGLGHQDYRPQHEFIFYSKGGTWYGDRAQADVWYCKRDHHGSYVHPTQKPVELIERALLNSSKAGDLVVDCFGGSGSTMIACEKSGRFARLMELDPRYCDVIVKRWQDFAGNAATLEGDGRTYAEIAAETAQIAGAEA